MSTCTCRHLAVALAIVLFVPGSWITLLPTNVNVKNVVVVVHAKINCPNGPTSSHHIKNGVGTCLVWGPLETGSDCRFLCDESQSIAAQYYPPGANDPFNGYVHNSAICCCYSGGYIAQGSDNSHGRNGTELYLDPPTR